MGSSTPVSAPFNVQHIPKIRNIPTLDHTTYFKKNSPLVSTTTNSTVSSLSDSAARAEKAASSTTENLYKNSIVVAIIPFQAEYKNEISCSLGDVFKLLDPKLVNGWLLVQSLHSGNKGWIPKDSIKVLDLTNSTPDPDTVDNNLGGNYNYNYHQSNGNTIPNSIQSSPTKSDISHSQKSMKTTSSVSVLDYYSSHMNNSNSSQTEHSIISSESDSYNILPYSSIFVHSMHSLKNAPALFWYRIDLLSKTNNHQKIHLSRYFEDLISLHESLKPYESQVDSAFPILPSQLNLARAAQNDLAFGFSNNISEVNLYLQQLFEIIKTQSANSPLSKIFVDFCTPKGNDFQHYVELDDDQILKILKPTLFSSSSDNDIRFDPPVLENQSLSKSPSIASLNSKNSSFTTVSYSSTTGPDLTMSASDTIKIKFIYRDEFSLIKLPADGFSFQSLATAISDKISRPGAVTLAYRNNNGIFVLLRDDDGLKRALLINSRKITIKVI